MSSSLALIFNRSITPLYRRRVIGRDVNLRLGNDQCSALDQSTYSVESTLSQKVRSSSSVLKCGIFFNFFISVQLLSMHSSCRNSSNLRSSQSKNNVQSSFVGTLADRNVSWFDLRVFNIRQNNQVSIRKYFLNVCGCNVVPFKNIFSISFIPIKC